MNWSFYGRQTLNEKLEEVVMINVIKKKSVSFYNVSMTAEKYQNRHYFIKLQLS